MANTVNNRGPLEQITSIVNNFNRGVVAKDNLAKVFKTELTFEPEEIDEIIANVCREIHVTQDNSSKVADLIDHLSELKESNPHLSELPKGEQYVACLKILYRQYYEQHKNEPSSGNFFEEFLKQYDLDPKKEEVQTFLIDLAKDESAFDILKLVRDKQAVFEVLKQIQPKLTAEHFLSHLDQFDLTEDQKINLAEFAATKFLFSKYVQYFKFENPKVRVDLAKLAASKGDRVSAFIKNYEIDDQDELFNIAMMAAQVSPEDLAEHIQNYGFTDENQLKTIALEAAEHGTIAGSIKNFGFKDQDFLFEVAKLCFLAEAKPTARDIANFGLTDQSKLVFLAKLGVEADPWTLGYLHNFGITDQKLLNELFVAAAAKDGYVFYEFSLFEKHKIESESDRIEIFIEAILNNPSNAENWTAFELPHEFSFFSHPFFVSDTKNYQTHLEDLLKNLGIEVTRKISDETDLDNLKRDLSLAAYLYVLNDHKIIPETQVLMVLRDPVLKKQIVKIIGKNIDHFKNGSSGSLLEAISKTWTGKLVEISSKNLKDAIFMRTVLQAMVVIEEDQTLSSAEKMTFMNEVLTLKDKSKQKDMLKSIIGIGLLGGSLNGVNHGNYSKFYQNFYNTKISIGNIDDFTTKYETTIQTFRDPNAILTYAGALAKLGDYERLQHMALYSNFVRQVLEGQFREARYKNSPHLDTIFKQNEALAKAWKEGKSVQIGDKTLVDTDDPCDLLMSGTDVKGSCQNIIGNPHKNKCLLTYLIDGKNRMIALKNKKGVIESRAIFRLLWDGEKPVLFLEATYYSKPEDLKLIQEFAKQRASALGLPLTSKFNIEGESYPKPLVSLGGPGLHEYVDANRAIYKKSQWSLSDAKILVK